MLRSGEMSTRSKRLVALAVEGNGTSPENSTVFSDGGESEYVPSSSRSESSGNFSVGSAGEPVDQIQTPGQANLPKKIQEADLITSNIEMDISKEFQNDFMVTDVYRSPCLNSNKYKKTVCKFCDGEIISRHFARHLQRNHGEEREVREVFSTEANSKERKHLLTFIRNDGNLEYAIRGHIIPKRRDPYYSADETDYTICMYCKSYYKRAYFSRHVKKCFAKCSKDINESSKRPLTESLVYTACQKTHGEVLNKLAVKKVIFEKMQADEITSIAVSDMLIAFLGDDLLKKTKNKRSLYHISNKLRECARFLLEMRKLGPYTDMLSTLTPQSFENAVEATKRMTRFNAETKTFGAASLALHFGTTLKMLANLAEKLVLRQKIALPVENVEESLKNLNRTLKLVESEWTTEIGSLALKDLNEKSAAKPKLLPVTEDIMKLKSFVEKAAQQAYNKLKISKTFEDAKILAETTLILTILHNRKRVGDIQYLDLISYKNQIEAADTAVAQTEMASSLTENEKTLTRHYKRIVAIGKGSRAVTILIPKHLQSFFSLLYTLRTTQSWFLHENTYMFAYPKSLKWIDGCSVIRRYAKQSGAKHPELLTSCRLRKHIATVTQVLSLKGNEIEQLSKFMGHTSKTHQNFYKLPQDIYQVAKVSKILQLMEKGEAARFKNKSLDEIEIDMEEIELDIENSNGKKSKTRNGDEEGNDNESVNTNSASNSGQGSEDFNKGCSNNDKVNAMGENNPIENIPDNLNESSVCSDTASLINEPRTSKKFIVTKMGTRQRWKEGQKRIMLTYFKKNVQKKRALKKDECEKFLDNFKQEFKGVTWLRVKTFIYNSYR